MQPPMPPAKAANRRRPQFASAEAMGAWARHASTRSSHSVRSFPPDVKGLGLVRVQGFWTSIPTRYSRATHSYRCLATYRFRRAIMARFGSCQFVLACRRTGPDRAVRHRVQIRCRLAPSAVGRGPEDRSSHAPAVTQVDSKLGVPVRIQYAAALDRVLSLDVVSCSYGVSRSLRSRTRLTVRPRPTFCMPKAATCGPDCGFWLAAHKNAAYGDLAQRPAGPQ